MSQKNNKSKEYGYDLENGLKLHRSYDAENPAYEKNGSVENLDKSKIDQKEVKEEEKIDPVSLCKLYSYASGCETFLVILGLLAALATGVSWPALFLVFGESTDNLTGFEYYLKGLVATLLKNNKTVTPDTKPDDIIKMMKELDPTYKLPNEYNITYQMTWMARYFAIVALCMFVLSYVSQSCLTVTAHKQTARIRMAFFRAVMRQNIGWFDSQSSGSLNNKLVDDINTIQEGIGDKFGQMLQWFVVGLVSIIIAFINGWKLSLVVLAVSPLIGVVTFLMTKMMAKLNQNELVSYGKAGSIAEEVLGSIRTVAAFRGEAFELERYSNNLNEAAQAGSRKGALMGLMMGIFNGLMFLSYALGFWYGAKLVREGELTTGKMLIIFFCCLMASMGFGQAAPFWGTLTKARYAAASIFEIIDRVPEIDKMSTEGVMVNQLEGEIELQNIGFSYPTRQETKVLDGLSLSIKPGQTIALVGASGCGKSSIIQLIQRFYDVSEGQIIIDKRPIKDYNIKSLREQIGVVSQEPVLFGCSIRENILYGRLDVTEEQIENAITMANAKGFIDKLPEGLDTEVGDRGTQLSGGQKQRIAIARALVRDPKLLLLDEATSALDNESESIVQAALDRARAGRTTIIIAHRLSTVRDADRIYCIRNGQVVEEGSHKELLALDDGVYKDLVSRQTMKDMDPTEMAVLDELKKEEEIMSSPQRRTSSVNESQVEIKTGKKNSVFFRVFGLNAPEKCFILLGCIGAMFNGATQPGFAVLFGYSVPAMANTDKVKQEKDIEMYVLIMIGIAVIAFVANILQSYFFSKSGEELTKRCRQLTFQAMLRQDIAWFDEPDNNLGSLTSRLSSEASQIRGSSGENLGVACQALFSMGAGVIISFIFTWQLSLLILAFVPLILIGGYLQIKVMQGFSGSDKETLEKASKVAVEGIENIRTVTNLTRELKFIEKYENLTSKMIENVTKKAQFQALLFAVTQATLFAAYSATFMVAGILLEKGDVEVKDIFISFGALMFGAMYLGNVMAMSPNMSKGSVAATKMFELIDRVPAIDSYSNNGTHLNPETVKGMVDIEALFFSYPLRPRNLVLHGFKMDVEPNTTVALVGSSGCGKSTIMQLIQRFYRYKRGYIKVDDVKIEEANIQDLRDCIGIVSQEPVLFSCSIRENIAYADQSQKYTQTKVEEAAKASNIHDFILTLPQGYDTKVNEKGSNLSGGQKQRIAIARALLKNPKILLLDEATSALDTESEKIVQDALDRAQEGRTSIVIAHRLSTIQNAHKIIVLVEGRISEQGTHNELMNKGGVYYNMVQQAHSKK